MLSGEGRGFCAGLDFGSFQAMAGKDVPVAESGDPSFIGAVPEGKITHGAQWVAHQWHTMPAPVIAAVHGVALGGGCQIALGADLRIAAPDARMSMLEIRWGLSPDMTGTQRLIELVGLDRAKELVFTGRMVDGTEARRIGLATDLAPDPRTRPRWNSPARSPPSLRTPYAPPNACSTRPAATPWPRATRRNATRSAGSSGAPTRWKR